MTLNRSNGIAVRRMDVADTQLKEGCSMANLKKTEKPLFSFRSID